MTNTTLVALVAEIKPISNVQEMPHRLVGLAARLSYTQVRVCQTGVCAGESVSDWGVYR